MIEIPEAKALVRQARELLIGRIVEDIQVMNSSNRFCWLNKEKPEIEKLITGKKITEIKQSGHYVRFLFSNGIEIACAEDIVYRYVKHSDLTEKNQLVLIFDNGYDLEIKVKLYGFILIGSLDELLDNHPYFKLAYHSIDVLSSQFTEEYFRKVTLLDSKKGTVKQALATEQHIPGLGNGVLHDILFDAKLLPFRKTSTLSFEDIHQLYQSIIKKIDEMSLFDGRDLQTDLFGEKGKYKTLMNSSQKSCPVCHHDLIQKSYLGGKVIYCPICQK
jgi:formamidopyrimidine-DNA glycosylase